jgi:hypothetical protein
MVERANELCNILHETYNTNCLNLYPDLRDFFVQVKDLYQKNPEDFPKANKTLMSLIHNLDNHENLPNVDYITGPGVVSKWESLKHNKVIYLFGENDHGNTTGCKGKVNLQGKTHMSIEKYLLDTFKHSPVFIDFYVEFGIMINNLEHISTTSGQTLWDMLAVMKGCFGPLLDRDCPYNVRMHGTDVRSILSIHYKSSGLADMGITLMMQNIFMKRSKTYIRLDIFYKIYKDQIDILSNVKNNRDLIRITTKSIINNKLIQKELKKSTIPKKQIMDFFVKKRLKENLGIYNCRDVGKWFSLLSKTKCKWPIGIDKVNLIITIINSVTMDVYTIARMFKVFKVKESDHYPKQPQNIIYYAGNGHTVPMAIFLNDIGFKRTEHSHDNILSCANMKNIKQPLFI